jgi:hypothetical protein
MEDLMVVPERIVAAVAGFACAAVVSAAAPAAADDFDCPPNRGAVVIDGNIIVVGECRLDGTLVKGNVFVEDEGDLRVEQATIIGNVQSDGARRVRLHLANVNGDVQLTGIHGPPSEVVNSEVGGTLDIEDNSSDFLLERNDVDSDLKANYNSSSVVIRGNDIGGNLQCQGNDPPPTGGNNTVDGNKEDQCERLRPGDTLTTTTVGPTTTTTTLPPSEGCGDHNGDGFLGSTDALILLRRAVGDDVDLSCTNPCR